MLSVTIFDAELLKEITFS